VQLVYWICLIIGGVFVAIATLGGLGDVDFDADGDVDFSADADMDYQIDTDPRLSQPSPTERPFARARRSSGFNLSFLTSFKFWTVGGCFFGLTGVVLSWVQPDWSPALVLGLAIAVGLLCGGTLTFLLRGIQRRQADSMVRTEDLSGVVGTVELPFDANSKGKVRIQVRGSVLHLIAMTNEEKGFQPGDRVLVIGTEQGRVWVAGVE
jgi:membrane protein implicated in regulation of membrane protease activity